jgi:hypothetical protein
LLESIKTVSGVISGIADESQNLASLAARMETQVRAFKLAEEGEEAGEEEMIALESGRTSP